MASTDSSLSFSELTLSTMSRRDRLDENATDLSDILYADDVVAIVLFSFLFLYIDCPGVTPVAALPS